MKAVLALVVMSLALIGASVPMDPFRLAPDGSNPMFGVSDGDSEAYFLAREQAVTAKFRMQDYGITLLLSALALAAFKWHPLKAPRSRLTFVVLAILAPLATAGALLFDLFQGLARWEFPPWADSLGIPIMGVPVLVVAGLVWAFGHFVLLAGGVPRRAAVRLSFLAVRRSHAWLMAVSALTAVLILGMVAEGAYWYAASGAIWLYFYASISAVRYEDMTGHPSFKRTPDGAAQVKR